MPEGVSIPAPLPSPLPPNAGDPGAPPGALEDLPLPFVIACLFTAAGGYLDAFSYIAHGRVFANAQTANFVLFAVFASAGQWARAWRHVPPILAFSLGVAVAKLSGVRPQKRNFRATLLCMGFEVAILALLAAVGNHLPDPSVVPTISFIVALQVTSFDRIGSWHFNSAMTTGNLRDAVAGLVVWIKGRDPIENRGRAIALGSICASFLAGALLGGRFTYLHPHYALFPCVALVLAGSLLTWKLSRMTQSTLPASDPSA